MQLANNFSERSLNPCCNGIYLIIQQNSWATTEYYYVLILVVMEYT